MIRGIVGNINWQSKGVVLAERLILFCFGEKCMTGMITNIKRITTLSLFEFEITVDFIEPDYFRDEAIVGNSFTIREASRILGEGEVMQVI